MHPDQTHLTHAAMVRRSRGKLEHGGAVVWEGGGCLVLVLVVVVVSLKAHFLYLLFFFSAILDVIFCLIDP